MSTHANLFCNYHRVVGHSTNNCFTLWSAIQDLIDRKGFIINMQEAPSTSTPPPASTPASGPTPYLPRIVHQPLQEHSSLGGAGTSVIHSIFSSGSATFMVDPFDLIQDISKPFPSSLYLAAVTGSESGIHMICLDAKPKRSNARPTMQLQAQPPVCLLARSQPEPSRPSQ